LLQLATGRHPSVSLRGDGILLSSAAMIHYLPTAPGGSAR
jgi:hypothetical protein